MKVSIFEKKDAKTKFAKIFQLLVHGRGRNNFVFRSVKGIHLQYAMGGANDDDDWPAAAPGICFGVDFLHRRDFVGFDDFWSDCRKRRKYHRKYERRKRRISRTFGRSEKIYGKS